MQALVSVKWVRIWRVQFTLFNTAASTHPSLPITERQQQLKTWISPEKVSLCSGMTDRLMVLLSKWHCSVFLRTADIFSHKIFLSVIVKKGNWYYEQGFKPCTIPCVIIVIRLKGIYHFLSYLHKQPVIIPCRPMSALSNKLSPAITPCVVSFTELKSFLSNSFKDWGRVFVWECCFFLHRSSWFY